MAKLDKSRDDYIEKLENLPDDNINNNNTGGSKVSGDFVKPVVAKTENQKKYLKAIAEKSIIICAGPSGSGKALTLNSKLYCKNGPILMKDVKLGDEIANPDGQFSKVLGVYPQGFKDVYRVHFSDFTYIDCCEEHLWNISHTTNGWKNKVVKTSFLETNCKDKRNRRLLSIGCTKPVEFDKVSFFIDPYVMGILISEGGLTDNTPSFTTVEKEILDKVNSTLHEEYHCSISPLDITYRICKKKRNSFIPNKYKIELQRLNLWEKYSYQKFIPESYLYSSIEQRIELLRGLMDGDGTIEKTGSVVYNTTSFKLAYDFSQLIYSLGGSTKIRRKKGSRKNETEKHRDSYNCCINLPNEINPFYLSRKKNKVKQKTKYFPKKIVEKVEKLDKQEEMQCISVDHKDQLYLTDNFTITHNTSLACGMAANLIKKEDNGIEKIILTRPIIESGEKIGYLPGSAEEKLSPYLVPLLEEFKNYISYELLKRWQSSNPKIIEVIPLAHVRGRNFHNAIIILDEAANATIEQLKLLLTRLGRNSKIIINGDVEQSDLPKFAQGGLAHLINRLEGMSEVAICQMENRDIVRNPLIGEILDRLK